MCTGVTACVSASLKMQSAMPSFSGHILLDQRVTNFQTSFFFFFFFRALVKGF